MCTNAAQCFCKPGANGPRCEYEDSGGCGDQRVNTRGEECDDDLTTTCSDCRNISATSCNSNNKTTLSCNVENTITDEQSSVMCYDSDFQNACACLPNFGGVECAQQTCTLGVVSSAKGGGASWNVPFRASDGSFINYDSQILSTAYRFENIPSILNGLNYIGSERSPWPGLDMNFWTWTIVVSKPGIIYIFFDDINYHGGLEQTLDADRWTAVPDSDLHPVVDGVRTQGFTRTQDGSTWFSVYFKDIQTAGVLQIPMDQTTQSTRVFVGGIFSGPCCGDGILNTGEQCDAGSKLIDGLLRHEKSTPRGRGGLVSMNGMTAHGNTIIFLDSNNEIVSNADPQVGTKASHDTGSLVMPRQS